MDNFYIHFDETESCTFVPDTKQHNIKYDHYSLPNKIKTFYNTHRDNTFDRDYMISHRTKKLYTIEKYFTISIVIRYNTH